MTQFDDGFGEETARRSDDSGVSINGVLAPEKAASLGGGAFGVLVRSNWYVEEQIPAPGKKATKDNPKTTPKGKKP